MRGMWHVVKAWWRRCDRLLEIIHAVFLALSATLWVFASWQAGYFLSVDELDALLVSGFAWLTEGQ